MYNYRLQTVDGRTLGVISLETEELPNLMLEGRSFILAPAHSVITKELLSMVIKEGA